MPQEEPKNLLEQMAEDIEKDFADSGHILETEDPDSVTETYTATFPRQRAKSPEQPKEMKTSTEKNTEHQPSVATLMKKVRTAFNIPMPKGWGAGLSKQQVITILEKALATGKPPAGWEVLSSSEEKAYKDVMF